MIFKHKRQIYVTFYDHWGSPCRPLRSSHLMKNLCKTISFVSYVFDSFYSNFQAIKIILFSPSVPKKWKMWLDISDFCSNPRFMKCLERVKWLRHKEGSTWPKEIKSQQREFSIHFLTSWTKFYISKSLLYNSLDKLEVTLIHNKVSVKSIWYNQIIQ